jgi:hypothetical protein
MGWPWRIALLVTLFLALRHLGIAWATLENLALYRQLQASGPPAFRIGLNALIGGALLVTFWGLYCKELWAFRRFWGIITASLIFQWVWLAWFAQADFDRGRLAFSAVTSLLLAGFVWWLHWRLRKNFGDYYA